MKMKKLLKRVAEIVHEEGWVYEYKLPELIKEKDQTVVNPIGIGLAIDTLNEMGALKREGGSVIVDIKEPKKILV